jgi:hypothetical protein
MTLDAATVGVVQRRPRRWRMIRPEDAELHEPTSDDPLWGETNYFGLYIPGVPLNIGVYALFRTNTGVVNTNVSVNGQRTLIPWGADYWDAWGQAKMPDNCNLRDYELPNGLRVRSPEPNRAWDVDYEHGPVSLHFRYTALMEAYDINDPEQDPMVAAKAAGSDFTWGHAYAGHFDQSGHYEGELVLYGEAYTIDCVSTMDHSWGVRQERQATPMSWLHAHVSEDLFVHGIFDFDPDLGPDADSPLKLTHGYVKRDSEMLGLKAGAGVARRSDFYPEEFEIEVTDASDRTFFLTGQSKTTFPWQAWPGTVGHNVLAAWQVDGQDGWGECMDFIGLEQLCRVHTRGGS